MTIIEEKKNILEKLFSFQTFGIKPGLDRTRKLLEYCGNPQDKFPSIHVAGTNGKGSVSSLLASIMTESDLKTGLYTSPHLVSFNERITINGKEIEDDEMVSLAKDLMPEAAKYGCTFFEITTAMAFKYFADKKIDIGIIEAGLGGRLDTTNVITPLVSIITNIDLDHQEYLGNTLLEIANEKAGIIKPHIPCVTGETKPEICDFFRGIAIQHESDITFSNEVFDLGKVEYHKNLTMDVNLTDKNGTFVNYSIPVAGKHQISNLKVVLSCIDIVKEKIPQIVDNITDGISNLRKNTNYMGRTQLIRDNPPIILDSAHNPAGIAALVDTLNDCGFRETKWNLLFGAMSDKDYGEMLHILFPVCKRLFVCQPSVARAAAADEINQKARDAGISDLINLQNVESNFKEALTINEPVLITGSFYLSGEIIPIMKSLHLL